MSRHVDSSSDLGTAPEKPANAAPVLSEQQRVWVREIAETIRERRLKSKLRLHPKNGAASRE